MANFKINDIKNINFTELLTKNKTYIYPILIYIAGITTGTVLFGNMNESVISSLGSIIENSNSSFKELFLYNFCVYISVFTVTVLLGLCLIGFPVLHSVPFIIGLEIGIKLSYYYNMYSIRGVVYSLLMIVPECAIFVTIILYTIVKSNNLSRGIFDSISKKSDMTVEISLKSYLKSFLMYAAIIVFISLINAGCSYFLSSIVKI